MQIKPIKMIAALILTSIFSTTLFAQEPPELTENADNTASEIADNLSNFDQQKINALLQQLKPIDLGKEDSIELLRLQGVEITPELILAYRTLQLQQSLALSKPVKEAKLNVQSERLNISSIQPPISISTRNGYDTFIEFYDLAGNPWPADEYISVGAKEMFDAVKLPDNNSSVKNHIVKVSAKDVYGDSTLTVQLKELKETVNFRLIHDPLAESVDYKRIFIIPRINREAVITQQENGVDVSGVQSNNKEYNDFIKSSHESFEYFFTGDVPTGSINIPVISGDATAWLYGGYLYVRTSIEILQYPQDLGVQKFSGMFVHKTTPFPRITYYKNSEAVVIQLDDESLSSAVDNQKRQLELSSRIN